MIHYPTNVQKSDKTFWKNKVWLKVPKNIVNEILKEGINQKKAHHKTLKYFMKHEELLLNYLMIILASEAKYKTIHGQGHKQFKGIRHT